MRLLEHHVSEINHTKSSGKRNEGRGSEDEIEDSTIIIFIFIIGNE